MSLRFLLALTVSLALPLAANSAGNATASGKSKALPGGEYSGRADVVRFAREVAQRRQLDRVWVEASLAQARLIPVVAKLIMPPVAATAKSWSAYRARFIEPERVHAGLAFWNRNQVWLLKAEEQYGVPPEIVVGIIGVETFFGRVMGGFRVIDALATLSFDFPTGRTDRSGFFRDELEQLLVLADRDRIDPLTLKGSYAGAMGLAQFMPSSLLKYAVDFDGDGRIDLDASAADAIGSVANYLATFGWQRGMASHFDVTPPVDGTDRAALLAPDIVPTFTPAQLAERGAILDESGRAHQGPLALIELENGADPPNYVAGTQNFYAVTRYNRSSYYAMAVISLAQIVRALRGSGLNIQASAR
jgi:membrane-bound lytic murein transglycosylase B